MNHLYTFLKYIGLLCFYMIFGASVLLASDKKLGEATLKKWKDEVTQNYFSKGKNVEQTAKNAIQLASDLKDSGALADLYKMLGVLQYFNGAHDKALQSYFSSLHLYKIRNDKKGESSVYNEIGTLYKKNNRLEEALDMFNKSFVIALELKDTVTMATAVNNSGIVYEMRNELKLALSNYFKALNYYLLMKDSIGQSYCYENIGGVYLMQKKYDKAEKQLLISLDYRLKKKMEQPVAFSYHYLGELYHQKGDEQKAINMYENCLEIAEKIKFPDLQQRVYYSLAESYRQIGNFKNGLDYYAKATSIKDSLFNVARSEQIAEMQTRFEVSNKDKENLLLKQSLDLEAERSSQSKLIIFFISLFTLVLAIGGILFYNRRQQLAKIQTQLEIHKAEQDQRLRISHDLHDHVGAQLSFVVSNLDIANNEFAHERFDTKRLKSVTEMSKQAIHTLRETVWALNNEAISVEAFSDKFKSFVQKISEFSDNIKIEFVDDIRENTVLPPKDALHLFRICQEAFNNALKHSNANTISIEIKSNTELFFQFKLRDNGIGFNEQEARSKGHYGLVNMQHRAAEIGARYQLITNREIGTEICVSIAI